MHSDFEFDSVTCHLTVEAFNLMLTNESNTGLGEWQSQRLPVGADLAPDAGHLLVGRVPGVEQLLASRQEITFGAERFCRVVPLFVGQRLANAKCGEGHPHSSSRLLEPLCR